MKYTTMLSVRKNLKFSVKYTACLLTWFMLAGLCSMAQEQPEGFVVDKIIAKVDNYIVLKSELDRSFQEYVANGGDPSPQSRCQYLAILIRNKLMMAKAEIDSIVVSDAEVDANTQRRMDLIISQYGGSIEELEKRFNKPLEVIKLELRDQIREQMLVSEMQSTITKDAKVTPSEVRRFFGRIPKDSLPFFSAEAEVAQLVRIVKIGNKQKEETRQQLMGIRDQLLRGEDFATLARKYSADPSVAVNGGDMGFVGRGIMVPEFEATCFRLKPGELSMPVETQFGLHLIQLLERRGNEYHARHILISPTPSPDDVERTRHDLDSMRTLIVKDSLGFQKAAKEYSDDQNTKGNGGFFTDESGGTRVPVDELEPGVFFAIDSMKVGTISKPLNYRTDDGKDAVRILFYKSKTTPHIASLQDDWGRIQTATLNQKKNEMLIKWFDKARKDVFISIDPTYNFCGILDE